MFQVYLPPMRGKLAGWLKGTIWTTYQPSAKTYASIEDARAAIAKAAQFHLKSVMKAAQIIPVDAGQIALLKDFDNSAKKED